MIFDATKVTYNMYPCAISGMSREIMKMDDRDSAECQNWEKRDKIGIIGIDLSHKKTKMLQCSSPQIQKKKKKRGGAALLIQ